MDEALNTTFVDFLKEHFEFVDSDIPNPGEWSGSGNTLGSIGLRVGLLSLDQIDPRALRGDRPRWFRCSARDARS